jgi:hypothetical protein
MQEFSVGDTVKLSVINDTDLASLELVEKTEPTTEVTTTTEETTTTTETTTEMTTTSDTEATTTAPVIEKVVVKGDANDDGVVQANDLLLVKKYVLQMIDSSALNLDNSDVDGNGQVNSVDIVQIKKYLLKMIDSFE